MFANVNQKLSRYVLECLRKAAKGDVTVRMPGNGTITINGKGIDYFDDTQSREQVCTYFFWLMWQKTIWQYHGKKTKIMKLLN